MAYEIYEKHVVRATSPRITLNGRGRLVFNVAATKVLNDAGIDTVFLLWDPEGRKFAVRATNNKRDPRACTVRFTGKDSRWASVAAKGFLVHIGHDVTTTKSYPATWNPEESMFEASMDADDSERETEAVGAQRRSTIQRSAGITRRAAR